MGDVKKITRAGNVLFAVGNDLGLRTFVSVSSDMGSSWNYTPSQPFRVKDNLKCIFFKDEKNGWVGGDKGIIYKTTDAGNSWQEKTDTLVFKGGIYDIYFCSPDTGYICGGKDGSKALIRTVDGGESWQAVTLPSFTDLSFTSMSWESSLKGIIVGGNGSIMFTKDGGVTWDATANKTGSKAAMYGISKSAPNVYFICGTNGKILKSTDGGQSFFLNNTTENVALYSIAFFNASEGIVCGINGAVYRSNDGGNNWTKVSPFTNDQLTSTFILADQKIAVGGNNGIIFMSADKGATWTTNTMSSRDYYSAFAQDSLNIVVAGGSSRESEINTTHDGGKSWQRLPLVISGPLYSIVAIGGNLYTCGKNGSYYFSANNGSNWESHGAGGSTSNNKLFFYDASNGFMVTTDGRILKTSDKGSNWSQTAQFSGNLSDIRMLSATKGFAVGGGDRIYETNDGTNWSHGTLARPDVALTGLYMLNDKQGFACGENGAVFRTNDGFKSVVLMTDTLALKGTLLHDVLALNDSSVWAVGQKGFILRSTSANSMSVVDTAFLGEELTSVSKLNSSSIAVCGYSGSVYKITDAGSRTVGVNPELRIAGNFDLEQNYPNPFNPETVIGYRLSSAGYVKLTVFDILGKEVAVLEDGFKQAGNHSVRFNALNHSLVSGIYFYRLQAGKFVQTRKMLVLK